jgi:hypothetical protein
MYATYHMQDPQVFYNKEDLLSIPRRNVEGREREMEPYYTIMRLPGEDKEEFVLLLPFTPNKRDNMRAWLAARSDAPHYGKLTALDFPKAKLVYGPKQIDARIDQDTIISRSCPFGTSGVTGHSRQPWRSRSRSRPICPAALSCRGARLDAGAQTRHRCLRQPDRHEETLSIPCKNLWRQTRAEAMTPAAPVQTAKEDGSCPPSARSLPALPGHVTPGQLERYGEELKTRNLLRQMQTPLNQRLPTSTTARSSSFHPIAAINFMISQPRKLAVRGMIFLALMLLLFFFSRYIPQPLSALAPPGEDWDDFEGIYSSSDKLSKFLQSLGPYSPAVFVLFQLLQVVAAPFPGELTGVAGGFVYGETLGFVLSTLGLTIGSWIAFELASILGRPFVERFISLDVLHKFDFLTTNMERCSASAISNPRFPATTYAIYWVSAA